MGHSLPETGDFYVACRFGLLPDSEVSTNLTHDCKKMNGLFAFDLYQRMFALVSVARQAGELSVFVAVLQGVFEHLVTVNEMPIPKSCQALRAFSPSDVCRIQNRQKW